PWLASRAIPFEASGNLEAPGIRILSNARIGIRINSRFRGRSFCSEGGAERQLDGIGGAKASWYGGIAAGRTVRQSGRRQSGRHQCGLYQRGGRKSSRRRQVTKSASGQS